MSVTLHELTLPVALELAENLDNRDRLEILRAYPDLESWAVDRCTLPGMAWVLIEDGKAILAGGVVSSGNKGTLWLAGRRGWRAHAKHAVRIWRAIRAAGVYERFECQCAIENNTAQRFAERMGFERIDARAGVVNYGMSA